MKSFKTFSLLLIALIAICSCDSSIKANFTVVNATAFKIDSLVSVHQASINLDADNRAANKRFVKNLSAFIDIIKRDTSLSEDLRADLQNVDELDFLEIKSTDFKRDLLYDNIIVIGKQLSWSKLLMVLKSEEKSGAKLVYYHEIKHSKIEPKFGYEDFNVFYFETVEDIGTGILISTRTFLEFDYLSDTVRTLFTVPSVASGGTFCEIAGFVKLMETIAESDKITLYYRALLVEKNEKQEVVTNYADRLIKVVYAGTKNGYKFAEKESEISSQQFQSFLKMPCTKEDYSFLHKN